MKVTPQIEDGRIGFVVEAETDSERVLLQVFQDQEGDEQNMLWIHNYCSKSNEPGRGSFYFGTIQN